MLMSTRYSKKSPLQQFMVTLLTFCFLLYFSWHAWHGVFGIKARMRNYKEIERLQTKLKLLLNKREGISLKIALLRDEKLESDLLTEQAMNVLWVAHKNDIIVYDESSGYFKR